MNQTEFLTKIKPLVIQDMKDTKILASLTAAQAFIESRYGTSLLAINGNNLFGVKGTYKGQSCKMLTSEFVNGKYIKVYANFKKYPSWQESINDHSALFLNLKRYSNLIGVTNYVQTCELVKKDGYATAPDYTNTLIKTIQKYMLYDWDNEALKSTKKLVNPYPKPERSIKLYSRGEDVKWLQFELNQNGYILKVDGIAGNITIGAVLDFQKKHNLVVDGIAGEKTIGKLV